MKTITVDWLLKEKACEEVVDFARPLLGKGKPLSICIMRIEHADWLIWLLLHAGIINLRQAVWIACLCGRLSLRYIPAGENRPRLAYEVAEAWVNEPTADRAKVAWRAARAARAAIRAAGEVAKAATGAAVGAARAAGAAGASMAAMVAREAARAATEAAMAAWLAAGAFWPAEAAEHRKMCDLIRAEIKKSEFQKLSWPVECSIEPRWSAKRVGPAKNKRLEHCR